LAHNRSRVKPGIARCAANPKNIISKILLSDPYICYPGLEPGSLPPLWVISHSRADTWVRPYDNVGTILCLNYAYKIIIDDVGTILCLNYVHEIIIDDVGMTLCLNYVHEIIIDDVGTILCLNYAYKIIIDDVGTTLCLNYEHEIIIFVGAGFPRPILF